MVHFNLSHFFFVDLKKIDFYKLINKQWEGQELLHTQFCNYKIVSRFLGDIIIKILIFKTSFTLRLEIIWETFLFLNSTFLF